MKSGICWLLALMLLGGVLYARCCGGRRLAPLRQAVYGGDDAAVAAMVSAFASGDGLQEVFAAR